EGSRLCSTGIGVVGEGIISIGIKQTRFANVRERILFYPLYDNVLFAVIAKPCNLCTALFFLVCLAAMRIFNVYELH
ncbi:MAG: hypothetical protein ACOX70_03985, partial [Syntrophaceticus schinkii]|nr:hypothetical protein [Syntrophaceticus schinkii]